MRTKQKSFLMKAINLFLIVITLGRMNRFMTHYVTTIGETIYVPEGYLERVGEQAYDAVMYHERVHIEQYRKEGWRYMIKYLIPRYRLAYELEAYARDIVYSFRTYDTELFGARSSHVVDVMTGPEYFWTSRDRAEVKRELNNAISRALLERAK